MNLKDQLRQYTQTRPINVFEAQRHESAGSSRNVRLAIAGFAAIAVAGIFILGTALEPDQRDTTSPVLPAPAGDVSRNSEDPAPPQAQSGSRSTLVRIAAAGDVLVALSDEGPLYVWDDYSLTESSTTTPWVTDLEFLAGELWVVSNLDEPSGSRFRIERTDSRGATNVVPAPNAIWIQSLIEHDGEIYILGVDDEESAELWEWSDEGWRSLDLERDVFNPDIVGDAVGAVSDGESLWIYNNRYAWKSEDLLRWERVRTAFISDLLRDIQHIDGQFFALSTSTEGVSELSVSLDFVTWEPVVQPITSELHDLATFNGQLAALATNVNTEQTVFLLRDGSWVDLLDASVKPVESASSLISLPPGVQVSTLVSNGPDLFASAVDGQLWSMGEADFSAIGGVDLRAQDLVVYQSELWALGHDTNASTFEITVGLTRRSDDGTVTPVSLPDAPWFSFLAVYDNSLYLGGGIAQPEFEESDDTDAALWRWNGESWVDTNLDQETFQMGHLGGLDDMVSFGDTAILFGSDNGRKYQWTSNDGATWAPTTWDVPGSWIAGAITTQESVAVVTYADSVWLSVSEDLETWNSQEIPGIAEVRSMTLHNEEIWILARDPADGTQLILAFRDGAWVAVAGQ